MTTTTLTAYQLAELLRKVEPHVGRNAGYGPIQGVRLDYDGRHLHAIATDRYTMAVARQKTRSSDPAWAHTLHGPNVDALAAWLKARSADGNARNVHITPGEYDVTFTEGDYTTGLTLPAMNGPYPEWRGVLRHSMENPVGEAPYSLVTSSLLARWEAAGNRVCTWQASASKPIVVVGNDFLGIQMPARFTDNNTGPNIADDIATWADSFAKATPVEMDDDLDTHEPQELEDRDNAIGQHAEDLLKQVLRSTTDMHGKSASDPAEFYAHIMAVLNGWTAYRLLKALQMADPDLLRTVLADTDEQLESGEVGEWAWDEAEKAGHNPQQWHDDYEAHVKALAAKKAADTAAA